MFVLWTTRRVDARDLRGRAKKSQGFAVREIFEVEREVVEHRQVSDRVDLSRIRVTDLRRSPIAV
jgi:hypothetical protein